MRWLSGRSGPHPALACGSATSRAALMGRSEREGVGPQPEERHDPDQWEQRMYLGSQSQEHSSRAEGHLPRAGSCSCYRLPPKGHLSPQMPASRALEPGTSLLCDPDGPQCPLHTSGAVPGSAQGLSRVFLHQETCLHPWSTAPAQKRKSTFFFSALVTRGDTQGTIGDRTCVGWHFRRGKEAC